MKGAYCMLMHRRSPMKPSVVKMSKKHWPSAAIGPAVIIHHHERALVDILSGEEEAVVVGPHAALQLAVVAGDVGQAAVAVGAGGLLDGGVFIDLVTPRQRRAPAIVIKGAREVMYVGGAVAFRAVVGVVEMQLGFGATEAAVQILALVLGQFGILQTIVDAHQQRLAVAGLDQQRRHGAARVLAHAISPDAVGLLGGHRRVEAIARVDFAEREDIADLGKELVPALMGEDLPGRATLHWPAFGDGVAKRVGAGRLAGIGGFPRIEIVVVGQALGLELIGGRRKQGIAAAVARERQRAGNFQPVQGLGELARTKQRAARSAGRDLAIGAHRR
jgi:hypothetical protein